MSAPAKFVVTTRMPIHDVVTKPLRLIPDERGWLMEVLRSDDRSLFEKFGQVYVSGTYPGVVKAWHYHKHQVDFFACVAGMVKLDSSTRARDLQHRERSTNSFRHTEPAACPRAQPRVSRLEVHQHRRVACRECPDRTVSLRGSGRVPSRASRHASLRLDAKRWLTCSSPAERASSDQTSCGTRLIRIPTGTSRRSTSSRMPAGWRISRA